MLLPLACFSPTTCTPFPKNIFVAVVALHSDIRWKFLETVHLHSIEYWFSKFVQTAVEKLLKGFLNNTVKHVLQSFEVSLVRIFDYLPDEHHL